MLEVVGLGVSPEGGLFRRPSAVHALSDIDLMVGDTEAVAVIGANGSGKTTLVRAIAGLVRPSRGSVIFDGVRLDRLGPGAVARAGVSLVPERRRVFGGLSVLDNLRAGSRPRSGHGRAGGGEDGIEWVLGLFPGLRSQAYRAAGTLTAGEQQVLAVGRALTSRPKLLLVDELSAGVQPAVAAQLFEVLHGLRRAGTSLLVVEQLLSPALDLAHKVYVVENGRIALCTEPSALCPSDVSWQSTHPGRGAIPPADRNKGAEG